MYEVRLLRDAIAAYAWQAGIIGERRENGLGLGTCT